MSTGEGSVLLGTACLFLQCHYGLMLIEIHTLFQELMRVMFDALEKKWKNTAQANLINKLYQGRMKDYVKCLEV